MSYLYLPAQEGIVCASFLASVRTSLVLQFGGEEWAVPHHRRVLLRTTAHSKKSPEPRYRSQSADGHSRSRPSAWHLPNDIAAHGGFISLEQFGKPLGCHFDFVSEYPRNGP